MKQPGKYRPQFLTHTPLVLGKEININMPDGTKHKGRFAIVDADTIIASHNENTFSSSKGYPLNADGTNINDRNYLDDVNAQKLVGDYARNLEPERMITTSRTPSGTPIITKDGFVVSGNNRTMSIKKAKKYFPEKYESYKDFLKEEIAAFGLSWIRIAKIVNPFLVRIDYDFPEYTTEQLAKYNKDTKKSERPIDKAVKLSHILRGNDIVFNRIADIVGKYETFSEFYANIQDQKKFVSVLTETGIITEQELPAYFDGNTFTESGKDFIEQMLGAMVLNRESLLATNLPGVKRYRQIIITSLPVLIANANLKEGSLNAELNKAILFLYQSHNTGSTLFDMLNQMSMFDKVMYNRKAVIVSQLLIQGRNAFKKTFETYNISVKAEESASLFGDKKSTDEIFLLIMESKIPANDLQTINNSSMITGNKKELPIEAKITDGFPASKYKNAAKRIKEIIEKLYKKYF